MTKRDVMASVRAACGVHRLDPRRLFALQDGACTWIGDRADLGEKDARALREIDKVSEADYDAICARCRCISATNGAGPVNWDDIPEDWQDGSALGPIRPL